MRLNLGCGNYIRTGFVNVDVTQQQLPPDLYRQGDISNLDWLCSNSSVEEMLALNVLQYIPYKVMDQVLSNWTNKLCSNGRIKILSPDINILCKLLCNRNMDLVTFLANVFGSQDQIVNFGKSATGMKDMCRQLESLGLMVVAARYENTMFYVEAIKQ